MTISDFDPSSFPDAHEVILPSRATLLSYRLQTLPARRRALADAIEHFDEAAATDDDGWRDMALLGLMAEAMQVLEDVSNIATAYESPLAGLPHYVTATTYSPTRANRFYSSLKNATAERFKILAGLWVRDPATQQAMSIGSAVGWDAHLDEADLAALAEAEQATVKLLRPYFLHLATTWSQFGGYFHAFKHGGLAINRLDFRLIDDERQEITGYPSIQVWVRKQGDGAAYGDLNLSAEDVAMEARGGADIAQDLAEHLVEARLKSIDALEFDNDGALVGLCEGMTPWHFWLHAPDLSEQARDRLRERFGIVFS